MMCDRKHFRKRDCLGQHWQHARYKNREMPLFSQLSTFLENPDKMQNSHILISIDTYC